MMNVQSVDSSNLASITGTTTTKGMAKDDFLKMLLAQLKNQDPLKPVDSTDFTSQLAQFSSLEQLTNMSNELKNLGLSQSSMNNAQSIDLIGKEITANSGNKILLEGTSAKISYSLASNAKQVTINVYDENGSIVDVLNYENQSAGVNAVTWNGGDLPKGNYTFEVMASDGNGNDITAQNIISGLVSDVLFKNNAIYLTVNGQEIPFASVLSVKQRTTS